MSIRFLNEKLLKAEGFSNSDQQKSALEKVRQQEQNWLKEFATPLVEKRKDVDAGNVLWLSCRSFICRKMLPPG